MVLVVPELRLLLAGLVDLEILLPLWLLVGPVDLEILLPLWLLVDL
ncbi:hypothetical protein B14911_11927 [Bacillus sp. NRRL B-14911]|nr:hypothetical protein B14911_11927 [Bacillus sp. NRRL B-14911]